MKIAVPFQFFLAILVILLSSHSYSCTFTVTNNCPYAILPGTLAGAGTPQLPTTGFELGSGLSVRIPSTPRWRLRTEGYIVQQSWCNTSSIPFRDNYGEGRRQRVRIVDGYNLPLIASPQTDIGGCNATGCVYDLNLGCPKELQRLNEAGVIGCKSACEAFGLDQYCCAGEFANPNTCRPSVYSIIFKRACTRAYSYAFDDGTTLELHMGFQNCEYRDNVGNTGGSVKIAAKTVIKYIVSLEKEEVNPNSQGGSKKPTKKKKP
ncbi:hypothetical protein C5167_036209 [Papaver somniferum]|nr:hypothetical protein C5167_036209 [Papaver somniferum]